ncbi:hypothetical protein KE530_16335 [Clostridiaceae bacterium Marseille-Q4145]|nr:hypothetical protein [Clostridiaceae bacterium Marseille-Q4145]
MYQDKVVLCGASAYEKKYYLNEDFKALPQQIQDELKIMCVLFTEDIGGVLTLVFDEEGNLLLEVSANEGDLLYDDIGSELKIRQIRKEKAELLQSLELYYKVFFLGEDVEG